MKKNVNSDSDFDTSSAKSYALKTTERMHSNAVRAMVRNASIVTPSSDGFNMTILLPRSVFRVFASPSLQPE
jgi:hypothetical protein